jgi:serine/threonine-protein kinase
MPSSVAVDTAGTLYVANLGNNTVTEYPAGSTSLSPPNVTINNMINSPTVAVDAAGTLYVAQTGNVAEYPAGTSTSSPSVTITGFPATPQFVFAVPGPLTP